MKKIVDFWKENKQTIIFLFILIYLNAFWIYFYEEMENSGWMTGLYLVQFFGLCTIHGLCWINSESKTPQK